jgi:hypothetical protein
MGRVLSLARTAAASEPRRWASRKTPTTIGIAETTILLCGGDCCFAPEKNVPKPYFVR